MKRIIKIEGSDIVIGDGQVKISPGSRIDLYQIEDDGQEDGEENSLIIKGSGIVVGNGNTVIRGRIIK